MFEKEAEERAEDFTIKMYDCLMYPCKTLEDCQLQSFEFDDVVNIAKECMEYGYNKANEWHYPSKGEYPEENVECLCIDKVWTGQTFTTILKFCDGVFIDGNGTPYDVIAWKEIVPPKIKEE